MICHMNISEAIILLESTVTNLFNIWNNGNIMMFVYLKLTVVCHPGGGNWFWNLFFLIFFKNMVAYVLFVHDWKGTYESYRYKSVNCIDDDDCP